jgi:glycosyltransferase involved in cell wall biosynthesis
LFADSRKEWEEASIRLRDPQLRQYLSENARAMVMRELSQDRILGKFETLFFALRRGEKLPYQINYF